MIEVLAMIAVFMVGIAILAVSIGALRRSRRSEGLGENRYELLRDQQERLELLREERRTLLAEVGRASHELRQSTRTLEGVRPRLVKDLGGTREGVGGPRDRKSVVSG